MMDDFELEMRAGLSVIEYVLEVLIANELALQPEGATEKFKRGLISKSGWIRRGPMDAVVFEKLQAESAALLSQFVARLGDREAQIRATLD